MLAPRPQIRPASVPQSLALWTLLLLVAAAMPRPAQPGHGAAQAEAPRPTATLAPVDAYRLALLELKGHLGVARTLLQVRAPGAAYHLQRPMQEIFREIEPQLEARDAPLSADTLEQLARATEATPQAALATIDLAAAAIDGSFAQTGALDRASALALIEVLLREAVDLYGEAVSDNEVVDVRSYRTGRGYVIQAEALVRHSSGLRGRPGQDELIAATVLIRQAWPGVTPPPIVFGPADVAERLAQAVRIMDQLR